MEDDGTDFIEGAEDGRVYAFWDGTNDLGFSAFIQDEQVAGTSNFSSYLDGGVMESLSD